MKCPTGFLVLVLFAISICGSDGRSSEEGDGSEEECECPDNEEWREDFPCSETCTSCAARSLIRHAKEERCFCSDDLVRIRGKCEPRKKCSCSGCTGSTEKPPTCGENQIWKLGNDCTEKCIPDSGKLPCPKNIYYGCFCEDGYKFYDGECVPAKDCPCGRDKKYTMCGSACPEQCPNSGMACIALCVEGCFCEQPYIQKNGKCVKKDVACPIVDPPPP